MCLHAKMLADADAVAENQQPCQGYTAVHSVTDAMIVSIDCSFGKTLRLMGNVKRTLR